MLWLPAARVELVKDAVPPDIVPVPSVVVPSLKVTVPVAPAGKVAVRVVD